MLSLPNNKFLMMRFAPIRFMAPLLAIWGMAILMFVAARDLGSALLFFGIAVAMTYMASGSKSYTAVAVIAFMLAAVLSYHLFGHVRVRFDIWLNPWSDMDNLDLYQKFIQISFFPLLARSWDSWE